jgi:EAL domain-containing protein (putative c-di-GMP-specific phosphodiesterase class I)
LEHELELALAGGQLELRYQPIVTLPDSHVAGFEALIRWRHPNKGLLPPSAFLPAAEASGLIRKIDAWAITQACAELRRFEAAARRTTGRTARGPFVPFVAVNVSAPGLADPDFLDHVHRTMSAAGVPPGTLRLELTETVLMAADPGRVLAGCRELGIGLALDDFGTGYSSLSYLHRFPVDVVKLDRSFVQDARAGAGAPPVLRGVLRLLRDLGLPTVAEGIECAEQASLLVDLGAAYGQGFHFARPMPASAARALLAAQPHRARRERSLALHGGLPPAPSIPAPGAAVPLT